MGIRQPKSKKRIPNNPFRDVQRPRIYVIPAAPTTTNAMTPTEIFDYISGLEIKYRSTEQELAAQRALMERQLEEQRKSAAQRIEDLSKNTIDLLRFYAVPMTTEEVAKFHGISTARVRDYASRGLIELHPNTTDKRMLFRASTALGLNFNVLKKQKSAQKQ